MVKLSGLLIGAGAALVLSACAQPQNAASNATPPPPPIDQAAEAAKARLAQEDANKQVVESYYRPGITTAERMALMTPDYMQHNPQYLLFAKLNNVQGRDGFQLMLETVAKLRGAGNPFGPPGATHGPKPPAGNALYKVIAEGDQVTVVHERYALQPGTKDQFYPVYAFVTYRVQDGKLAEDWDDNTLPNVLPIYLRVPVSKLKFPKQPPAGG